MPVVLSASGEISRIEPMTAMSGRPWSQTLTGMPSFAWATCSLATAKTASRSALPGDLDHLLARGHDLARVGLGRRHDAVVGRKEFGVAQLVLRDAKIGFGRLDLRLGALQRLERVLVEGVWSSSLSRAGCGSAPPAVPPGRPRPWRGKFGLGGGHLVLVVDGAELGELLALPDDVRRRRRSEKRGGRPPQIPPG